MNIEPICAKAMNWLKNQIGPFVSLGTVTDLGEISEIEFYKELPRPPKKIGSVFVTNENPRIVGFKYF